MLKFQNCYKSFGDKKVLTDVTLTVPEKSIFGFVGVNGAGKSTLIKCLFLFLKLNKGQILFNGEQLPSNPSLKKKMGYLPEVFTPPLDLKAHEFLDYTHALSHGDLCAPEKKEWLLSKVGLLEKSTLLIKNYSKGMRQRLGIAQALIHEPDLLVLDEPFSGLDPIGRHELVNLLYEINKEGVTLFFSSHNLNEIQDLCSHVGVLHDGKVSFSGIIGDYLKQAGASDFEQAFLKTIDYLG